MSHTFTFHGVNKMKNKRYMVQYYDGLYKCWRDLPRLTYNTKEEAHSGATLYQMMMNRTVRVKEIKE